MNTILIIIFVIVYAAIALEHPLKVNKSAPALIGAGLLWTIYAVSTGNVTVKRNAFINRSDYIFPYGRNDHC
jgi:Na+/H+ antiporter NhaD/arsenite permease-like protein